MTRREKPLMPSPAARAAPEPYLRRERARRLARFGLFVVLVALVWTVARWPDARRVSVPCTVVSHHQPRASKRGYNGDVSVEVDGKPYVFAVARSATQGELDRAFAAWPVGSVQTCGKLPYRAPWHEVEASRASWAPPLLLLFAGLAWVVWAARRAARWRPAATPPHTSGHPFREAAERPAMPEPLALGVRAFDARPRKLAWVALLLWISFVGAFALLFLSAPNPVGSLFEPESPLRLGVLVFGLLGLGLPGGVVLWPALHVLGARHAVWLDGACGGAIGAARGVPGLCSVVWKELPGDAAWRGDALASAALVYGEEATPLVSLPWATEADRRAVEAWLEEWRAASRSGEPPA